jgi:L-rhamnose isomerase/sugar isomerase
MIQTAVTAQELYAKACLVDRTKLRDAQTRQNIIDAEECLRTAFYTDVKPMLAEWRKKHGIAENPMAAYRASGYEAKVGKEREASRAARGVSAGGSYA